MMDDGGEDGACYVYFLQQKDDRKTCKIGMSSSPHARVEQLQTGNPQRITIRHTTRFATRRAARACEYALHQRYRRQRVSREWFALDDKQLDDAIQRSVAMSQEGNSGAPSSNNAAQPSDDGGGAFWWSSLIPPGLLAAGRTAVSSSSKQQTRRWIVIGIVVLVAIVALVALVASSSARRCVGAWCRANADRVVNRALDTALDRAKRTR